jgi:hypothetical protein
MLIRFIASSSSITNLVRGCVLADDEDVLVREQRQVVRVGDAATGCGSRASGSEADCRTGCLNAAPNEGLNRKLGIGSTGIVGGTADGKRTLVACLPVLQQPCSMVQQAGSCAQHRRAARSPVDVALVASHGCAGCAADERRDLAGVVVAAQRNLQPAETALELAERREQVTCRRLLLGLIAHMPSHGAHPVPIRSII